MRASLVRHTLGNLVPPKIASPSAVVRGAGASMASVVDFYSKLPKGPAKAPAISGIKAKFFNGKNASVAPFLGTLTAILLLGYTIDYNSVYSYLTIFNRVLSFPFILQCI
ncbi:mitochondrial F1-F0 ATP synthase subunit F of fungi-domain-containing protein [Cantharellus anzutake]|uniref:mitochondrial F1-F0 ATP synthase subunit F of fungi-domain-containing protein n=1 Tax=Cantharellus anzutake TaxID=1750568 RepID=UPI001906A86D|nr:mitochondrial F1-F0 ATP synthase subunit F of fungi-domain-containing protein [Cantharellus anzutake]KAF8326966.1 mitochondrial F1-F0 ATP synthase subunit F of fungi-domain-containing protein [Cantharellus anzutake]